MNGQGHEVLHQHNQEDEADEKGVTGLESVLPALTVKGT